MTSLSVPLFHPDSKRLRVAPRAHIVLSELDAALLHPVRGPPMARSIQADTKADDKFFDNLLARNNDIWEQMVNNDFCAQLSKTKKGDQTLLGNFKWYMLQDMLYLKYYVYWKLGVLSAADWVTLVASEAPTGKDSDGHDLKPSITRDIGYVQDAIKELKSSDFSISASKIQNAVVSPEIQKYADYMLSSAHSEDWFTLNIITVPCLVGYETIANKYKEAADKGLIDKESLFYTQWVAPNANPHNIYREQCKKILNENVGKFRGVGTEAHWDRLFKTSCEMELNFWNAALKSSIN